MVIKSLVLKRSKLVHCIDWVFSCPEIQAGPQRYSGILLSKRPGLSEIQVFSCSEVQANSTEVIESFVARWGRQKIYFHSNLVQFDFPSSDNMNRFMFLYGRNIKQDKNE